MLLKPSYQHQAPLIRNSKMDVLGILYFISIAEIAVLHRDSICNSDSNSKSLSGSGNRGLGFRMELRMHSRSQEFMAFGKAW